MRFFVLLFLIYSTLIIQSAIIPALGLFSFNLHFDLLLVLIMGIYLTRVEALTFSVLLGFVMDYLTVFSFDILVFIFPLLAYSVKLILQKFWGKPGIVPFIFLTLIFAFLYQLLIYGMEFYFFSTDIKAGTFIWENRYFYGKGLLKSLFFNGLFLAPLFYFPSKRINELFEYWEQRKRI